MYVPLLTTANDIGYGKMEMLTDLARNITKADATLNKPSHVPVSLSEGEKQKLWKHESEIVV